MIDVPLCKALVAVEAYTEKEDRCLGCAFTKAVYRYGYYAGTDCENKMFHCHDFKRKDGKNVILKLVDIPEENKK